MYLHPWKIARDAAILATALGLTVYEVIVGGARPEVFAFLGALFVSPLVMRADQRLRNGQNNE
jgi:hypothetical protein